MAEESSLQIKLNKIVIAPSSRAGNYIFAQPLRGELAAKVYRGVNNIVESKYSGLKAFSRQYWGFDNKSGVIRGSSPFLNVLADMQLAKFGLYIPSIHEARILDYKEFLSNGVYRDFGVVLYDNKGRNNDVANSLIRKTNIDLPLILPFRALSLKRANNEYGVGFTIKNTDGVISGKYAKDIIDSIYYKTDSGFHRLHWFGDGTWDASWSSLADSNLAGCIDWVCGEVAHKDLEANIRKEIIAKYEPKMQNLQKEIDEEMKAALGELA